MEALHCLLPATARFLHNLPRPLTASSSPWKNSSFSSIHIRSSSSSSSSPLVCRAVLELEPEPEPEPEPELLKKKEKLVVPDLFEIDREEPNEVLKLLFESKQGYEAARHYEAVFLVHENRVDELQDVIKKVKDFVREKKGRIWRLDDWGMRKLAYKIQKARNANYILMNIQIQAQAINEFKTLLDKDERVIRHLVITRGKAMTEKTEAPPEFFSLKDEVSDSDEDYEEGDDEEEYEDDENEGADDEANKVKAESLA